MFVDQMKTSPLWSAKHGFAVDVKAGELKKSKYLVGRAEVTLKTNDSFSSLFSYRRYGVVAFCMMLINLVLVELHIRNQRMQQQLTRSSSILSGNIKPQLSSAQT